MVGVGVSLQLIWHLFQKLLWMPLLSTERSHQYQNIKVAYNRYINTIYSCTGTARRGASICKVIPNLSSIFIPSGNIPLGSFHANECRRDASDRCTILKARGEPGHILRPAPNGINWQSWPLKSSLECQNLSGKKQVGFVQTFGSLPMAHAFTIT